MKERFRISDALFVFIKYQFFVIIFIVGHRMADLTEEIAAEAAPTEMADLTEEIIIEAAPADKGPSISIKSIPSKVADVSVRSAKWIGSATVGSAKWIGSATVGSAKWIGSTTVSACSDIKSLGVAGVSKTKEAVGALFKNKAQSGDQGEKMRLSQFSLTCGMTASIGLYSLSKLWPQIVAIATSKEIKKVWRTYWRYHQIAQRNQIIKFLSQIEISRDYIKIIVPIVIAGIIVYRYFQPVKDSPNSKGTEWDQIKEINQQFKWKSRALL